MKQVPKNPLPLLLKYMDHVPTSHPLAEILVFWLLQRRQGRKHFFSLLPVEVHACMFD